MSVLCPLRLFSPYLVIFSGLLLVACGGGSSKLSLEEAENVTLNYEGQNYTPPPRTIDTILEEIKAANQGLINERGHVCRMCPSMDPNDPNVEIRMSNLAHLAMVSHHRGNSRKAIKYMADAYKLMSHKDIKKQWSGYVRNNFDHEYFKVLHRASLLAVEAGRYSDGMRYIKDAVEINTGKDKPYRGKALFQYSYLARSYAEMGDVENAEDALDDAISMHDTINPNHPRVKRLKAFLDQLRAITLGRVSDAKGDLREAEEHYRNALGLLETIVRGRKGRILTMRAEVKGRFLVNNLLAQGRIAEAEAQVLDGIRNALETFGRDNHVTAKVLQSYVRVLMARSRYDDAKRLIQVMKKIYKTIGTPPDSFELAKTYLLLAEIYVAENNWDMAAKIYQVVYKSLETDPETRDELFNDNINWALTLSSGKKYNQAVKIAKKAIDKNQDVYGSAHVKTAEAQGVLAMIYAQQRKFDKAEELYQTIVPVFTNPGDGGYLSRYDSGSDNQRIRQIMEAYLDILASKAGSGDSAAAARAFYIAQTVQGKSVQGAVASSAARASIKDPELVQLVRKEQDATRKIEAGYNQLVTNQGKGGTKDLYQSIKERVGQLVKAREAILAEIRDRFSEYDNLVRPKPISVDKVRPVLKGDEVLLMVYSGEDYSYIWSVSDNGAMSMNHVKFGKSKISKAVTTLRKGLDLQATNVNEIPAFDTALSYQLYRVLLSSSKSSWGNAKHLVIVADGALSRLPFSVLVTKPTSRVRHTQALRFKEYRAVPWLANNYATSYVPSISTLVSLRNLKNQKQPTVQFAGFGNPVFGQSKPAQVASGEIRSRGMKLSMRGLRRTSKGSLDNNKQKIAEADISSLVSLPETADEVLQVAGALRVPDKGHVFLGKNANEAKVKGMKLDNRRVLMFATHALIPGDLDGLVQPAIALSTPRVSKAGNDGLLTMSEIMGLNLNADWVVLSACNTGAGSGRGATALSGLGQAFFYAGSRSLLISHWPVETISAKQITTSLFAKQVANKMLSRAEALTLTMRDLIKDKVYKDDQGKAVFSYAHPVFWSPFTVVGDGAGTLN